MSQVWIVFTYVSAMTSHVFIVLHLHHDVTSMKRVRRWSDDSGQIKPRSNSAGSHKADTKNETQFYRSI
jgi:hypothetical protein